MTAAGTIAGRQVVSDTIGRDLVLDTQVTYLCNSDQNSGGSKCNFYADGLPGGGTPLRSSMPTTGTQPLCRS